MLVVHLLKDWINTSSHIGIKEVVRKGKLINYLTFTLSAKWLGIDYKYGTKAIAVLGKAFE